jgi:hypothetical protein
MTGYSYRRDFARLVGVEPNLVGLGNDVGALRYIDGGIAEGKTKGLGIVPEEVLGI